MEVDTVDEAGVVEIVCRIVQRLRILAIAEIDEAPRYKIEKTREVLGRGNGIVRQAGVLIAKLFLGHRKRFIGQLTGREPKDRLAGTIASNVLAVAAGASIVRVHDVAPLREALAIADAVLAGRAP